MMFGKGSKLYAIFKGVCPKCHGESMYKEKNLFKITRLLDMHERCSICQTKYKMEPSFFYGAMYVSYAVGIAFAVVAFVIAKLFLNASLIVTFLVIVVTLIIAFPIIIRVSRNIWINFFVTYSKNEASDKA